ncbi:hypothetical protein HFN_1849 [Helicobacter fennelliae MRY12-0050]|uniref:Uncharacterized protein n=1 Tax=Helicobacter fennelliae MRY12-0050 TaxID=1325130 RepID=T1CZ65_9HELI|nr:hypothetical protein HFN_1849 [Helicobacter fennelliae MRY12-0050]
MLGKNTIKRIVLAFKWESHIKLPLWFFGGIFFVRFKM